MMTTHIGDVKIKMQNIQVETSLPRSVREAEERSLALLQYFQPDDLNQLSLAKESSALNEALAPHLQLLCHQCQVEKTFISVFDRDLLYIIAEASPDSDAEAFFGVDCIGRPLQGRLCTFTLDAPVSPPNAATQPLFQVEDLSKDDRFKTYPFVADVEGPQYRYYAGLPIITPRGVAIGTVAMLGKESRSSLNHMQERSLRQMSARIMDYFNVRKDAADGRRLTILVNNLSQFVVDVPSQASAAPSRSTAFDTGPNKISKIRRSGYRVTDNTEIFDRAVISIETALRLEDSGGVLFLKSRPDSRLPSSTNETGRVISCSKQCSNSLSSCTSFDFARLAKTELRGLLDQYPRGKLWQYDVHGILPSIDSDSEHEGQPSTPSSDISQNDVSWDTLVRNICPQARQILMVPLLDAATSEWNSACFVWSASALRLFSKAELGTLLTYGQAIMAECSLQDAMKSGLQKADFVGSISHELRTPLHGILAGLEFVKEEDHLTDFQASVLSMIETSGEALLDTVNHILEFSKINTFENTKRKRLMNNTGHKRSKSLLSQLRFQDTSSADFQALAEVCNVALLTEQAADMIYLGKLKAQATELTHLTGSSPSKSGTRSTLTSLPIAGQEETTRAPNVELILDIANEDYHYYVQKGALKRVMINIISNALKYTHEGTVVIRLYKEKSLLPNGTIENVVFECNDTGCGMSDVFIKSRLFTPFTQEDPVKPGTGLGLSICKSIVESIGGEIQVESAVGKGATFRIVLPFPRSGSPSASARSSFTSSPVIQASRPGFVNSQSGMSFVRRPEKKGSERNSVPTHDSLDRVGQYLQEWFKMTEAGDVHDLKTRFALLDASAMDDLLFQDISTIRERPIGLLVICDSLTQQVQLERKCKELKIQYLACICKPCGPFKLISHVEGLLEQMTSEPDNKAEPASSTVEIGQANQEVPNGSSEKARDTPFLNGTSRPPISLPISLRPSQVLQDRDSIPRIIEQTAPVNGKAQSNLTRQPRILLVDDNNINLRLLQSFCTRRKYTNIHLATDGQIAVNVVKQQSATESFDIIFMDISMPVMNGFEATSAIRQYEKSIACKPARIIALTGLANERDCDEGIKVGMDLYLTKPFRFQDLDLILQQWAGEQVSGLAT